MSKIFINIFKMIKNNKRYKYTLIVTIMLLFISIIGYSLSFFNKNNSMLVANIKVNDLSFNITTNNGESDDRILRLQAGKTESFNIILTNLNNVDIKYELLYELCSDSKCTSTSKTIPNELKVLKLFEDTEIFGNLLSNDKKTIPIITKNNNPNDYYIKLNINAGYIWNDLAQSNQIIETYGGTTKIIAYVEGKEVESLPSTCVYKAELKGYKENKEVELENASAVCDFNTNKWTIKYTEPIDNENKSLVDKIVIYFTPGFEPGTFASDSWTKIAEVVKHGHPEAYAVGSEKEVLIGNSYYTVRVANNTTPEECNNEGFSETACGFVVEFVDIVENRIMNSTRTSVGGWPATELRTYANGDFLNKLPTDLQNIIIDTKVISGHGNTSGEGNFISTDKIYLLSIKEVWIDATNSSFSVFDTAYNDTRQLDYYALKEVTANNYTDAKKSSTRWWLRTATSTGSNVFHMVNTNGSYYLDSPTYSNGFSPAFRIG